MTNYRFEICEIHDKPQFNYCFDCGAPLREEILEGKKTLTCSRLWPHVMIWIIPHGGDLESDCEGVRVES